MKKMLTIIVPLAMLVCFASVGLAADEVNQNLNSELSQDISPDLEGVTAEASDTNSGIEDGDSPFDDTELNDTNSREASSSIATRRGRQPRRGQTASQLSDVQQYWGDFNSGDSDDEDADEDEDDDVTPV